MRIPLSATAAGLLLWAGARGQSWPDYRGPGQDGQAAQARVPLVWSETKNVRWKTKISGQGWSSPVVEGGRVWLTTATPDGKRLFAVAVDLDTGEKTIERALFEVETPQSKHPLNSYASPSPVAEPGRVWVHFGTYGTACLDSLTGETLWERRDLHCDHIVGPGSSPCLWGDVLVLNMDGGDVQYVVGLDKRTGATRWQTPRSVRLDHLIADERKAYSTPIVVDVAGLPWLVSSGAEATCAYDPDSGRELWRVRHKGFSMASRPIAGLGLLFLNTGYNRPNLLAVHLGGEGDVTDTQVAWTYRRNVPTMPSPLLVGGRLYMVDDSGILSCLRAESGELVWRHRIGGEHSASPVHAGGRLYFFDRDGVSVVVAPGDEYRQLARNEVAGGFMASPAVVGDAFVLRTRTHLYRIEEAKGSGDGEVK